MGIFLNLAMVVGRGRVGWEVDLGGWVQVVGRYGVEVSPRKVVG